MADDNFTIQMEGARGQKFYTALWEAIDANQSLVASMTCFPPSVGMCTNQIEPRLAIEAFTNLIADRLQILQSMVNDEDVKQEQRNT